MKRFCLWCVAVSMVLVLLAGCRGPGRPGAGAERLSPEVFKSKYESVAVGTDEETLLKTFEGASMAFTMGDKLVFQCRDAKENVTYQALFQVKDGKVESKEWKQLPPGP